MNTLVGILFSTRKTFQKLDNEFIDDLNRRAIIIFFVAGLGTGIKSISEESRFFFNSGIWQTTLWLTISGLIGLVIGRYILSPALFRVGILLKGKAEFVDVMVVTAYSMVPTLIEVPIAIYKVFAAKEGLTDLDYMILNGLHWISWALSIKILIQGLRDFNEFGTMKAIINILPLIALSGLVHLIYYLVL